MPLCEFGLQGFQRGLQANLRQARGTGQGVIDRVQAMHIAPHQARRFGGTVAAKQFGPLRSVVVRQRGRRPRRSAIVMQQGHQQVGLPAQRFEGEVAGSDHARHAIGVACVGEQDIRISRRAAQPRQAAFDQGIACGIEGQGCIVHGKRLWHGPRGTRAAIVNVGATSVATRASCARPPRTMCVCQREPRMRPRGSVPGNAIATDVAPTPARPARATRLRKDPATRLRAATTGRTAPPCASAAPA